MKILVLDVPGLHLGFLGCYGNDWIATPALDTLAAEGVVFDRHFADGASGLYTGRCDIAEPGIVSKAPAWFGLLEKKGVVCLTVDVEGTLGTQEVLRQGRARTLQVLGDDVPADDWLVWVRLPCLLPPWDIPEDVLSMYREDDEAEGAEPAWDPRRPPARIDEPEVRVVQDTYAAVVTLLDAEIEKLLAGLGKEVLVCVTSAHGLPLGEHGWVGLQRAWQHEELVHLPLQMRLPGKAEAGLRIGALTQPVDVVATILECCGVTDATAEGRSLWPIIRGNAAEIRPAACSWMRLGESEEWSLRTLEWAMLLPVRVPADDEPRAPQLYVKPDDRWEVNDVAQHHPDLAETLEKQLRHEMRRRS